MSPIFSGANRAFPLVYRLRGLNELAPGTFQTEGVCLAPLPVRKSRSGELSPLSTIGETALDILLNDAISSIALEAKDQ